MMGSEVGLQSVFILSLDTGLETWTHHLPPRTFRESASCGRVGVPISTLQICCEGGRSQGTPGTWWVPTGVLLPPSVLLGPVLSTSMGGAACDRPRPQICTLAKQAKVSHLKSLLLSGFVKEIWQHIFFI